MFSGIPVAEKFSFCLHTLLCDIAVKSEHDLEEIVDLQVKCLVSITQSIKKYQNAESLSSSTKLFLCKTTLPVLIGLARAMGRFCTLEPPLICQLFPKNIETPVSVNSNNDGTKRSFSNFRSIIPRSLSCNLSNSLEVNILIFHLQSYYIIHDFCRDMILQILHTILIP